MAIIFTILNLVMILVGIGSFIWTLVGVPLGLFFLFRFFTTKDTKYKKSLPKKILLSFLGVIILVLTPVLWAVVNILKISFLGDTLQHSEFGNLKTLPVQ